ncbi:hypothetical protein V2A60_001870 [Cordyceps javanica]
MSSQALPFSIRLLAKENEHNNASRQDRDQLLALLPASYRKESGDLGSADLHVTACVERELDLQRLSNIQDWLWVAGLPLPPRALHHQLLLGREIFITEQIDMHLIVPEMSACIDGHRKISLRTDHLKINKFYGSEDPSFRRIYPEIVRMAANADRELTRRRNPEMIPTDEESTSGNLRKCLQEMRLSNDLSEYIDVKVGDLRDINGEKYPAALKQKVRKALKDRVGGTFLWASLMLAELRHVFLYDVEEKLKNLPQGLNNTYTMVLDRIPNEYRETAHFILWFMVAARRPLKKAEIQTAYAICKTKSVPYGEDLELYNDIHSACSSLMSMGREDDAIFNFCHQTVKDFLLHEPSTTGTWYHCTESEAHLRLFKACWVYLSAEQSSSGSQALWRDGEAGGLLKPTGCSIKEEASQYSFLEYSSSECVNHAIASHDVLLRHWHEVAIDVTILPALRDSWFLRAAGQGQEAIVELLLDKGADINTKDKACRTPLSWAAEQGHENVAKLLLDNDADTDSRDSCGRTPLSWAAATGRTSVVALLLRSGNASADAPDDNGRTPLSYAAESGHEAIVRRLLSENINVNSKYHCMGQVTMLYAIRIDGQEVAQMLFDGATKGFMGSLTQSAPKCFDLSKILDVIGGMTQHEYEAAQCGKSPLLLSTGHGLGNVELVLIRDVDEPGAYGQTPLHLAAWHGHGKIVKMLLDVDGIVAHTIDEIKRTPLLSAAAAGHVEVVELLLAADGVDRDFKDADGQTALSWAIKGGHNSIVELLQSEQQSAVTNVE